MFDTKKFMREKFTPREKDVPVPNLSEYFIDGSKPVWRVRNLTGPEVGRANEAAARNKNLLSAIELLADNSVSKKIEGLKSALSLGNDLSQDVAKRIEQLVIASVEPVCDLDLALKLCKNKPEDFYLLTNWITKLTGAGMMPGESKDSGKKQT